MGYGAIIGQTPTVQASAEMTSYNNDNTSSVITADNVQGAIDQLFTSVSNGKSQIASAITGMGVSTSANDSFAQMATNIGNIETGYDTSQVTATANTVRSGYKFVNSSGQLITGTIPSKGAQTYTPKTVSQTISSGQYLSGNQTIQGDENLKASNIKSGVSIFGVSGSYTGNRGEITSIRQSGNSITFYTDITLQSYILGSILLKGQDPYNSLFYSLIICFNYIDYISSGYVDNYGYYVSIKDYVERNIISSSISRRNMTVGDDYFTINFSNLYDIDYKLASWGSPTRDGYSGKTIFTYN